MLSHATHTSPGIRVSCLMDGMIGLVFKKPSGRIRNRPNCAAAPGFCRGVGGAVKRELPVTVLRSRSVMFRVFFVSFRVLLFVCFLCVLAVFRSAAQAPPDENRPKDVLRKEEAKDAISISVDDVRKDTPGKA